jgi:xanthine dehydrogenase small subunit
MSVHFVLNGKAIEVGAVDPHVTLLQWLRSTGATGAKEGCAEGECGACAVAIVQADALGKPRYTPVNSCLVPLPAVHGQSLISVEGVAAAGGELHPVQQQMVERGGSQCGYCTPGFVVSLFCEYYRDGRSGYDSEAISGNLCRCTGYRPIADVARSLPLPAAGDPKLAQLSRSKLELPSLDHGAAGYRYVRPTSLSQLFELWERSADATPIAGGTDLMVYANQRYQRFGMLLALDALPELREICVTPAELTFGAGVPLAQLEERMHGDPALQVPLLGELWPLFSSRLIRNRATLGGNLATASPIGDCAPALLALDAELTLASVRGTRRVALREFFTGYRQSLLGPRELITHVHVPLPLARTQRFYKVSKRVLDDISTVAGAFTLDLQPDLSVERLRVAYGGVAATPIRALPVEQLALGKPWTEATLALLQRELALLGTPLDDHRGSAAYRRAMLGRLLDKFFAQTRALLEVAQ